MNTEAASQPENQSHDHGDAASHSTSTHGRSSTQNQSHDEGWRESLKNRGILQAAIEAGVEGAFYQSAAYPPISGMSIPLFDEAGNPLRLPCGRPAQHFKNLNSNAKPKYLFGYGDSKNGEKMPANHHLYVPPQANLDKSIPEAGQVAYLVAGEPDAWTLLTVGMFNVVSLYGELSKMEAIVDFALRWELRELWVYPDLDKTGKTAPDKLKQLLDGTGVALRIFRLPDQLHGKQIKDVNDAFVASGCDTAAFRDFLDKLPPEFYDNASGSSSQEAFREKRYDDQGATGVPHHAPSDVFDEALYSSIAMRLGVQRYAESGWSNYVECPFGHHEDDARHPKAGWHRDMHILHCFKCGQRWLAKEVAEMLGIDWREYTSRAASSGSRWDRRNGKAASSGYTEAYDAGSSGGRSRDPETRSRLGGRGGENTDDFVTGPKGTPPTDDEIGDFLIRAWDGNVRHLYEQWYRYDNGVWVFAQSIPREIWDAMRAFKEFGVRPNNARANSIEAYLRANLSVEGERVDQGSGYINVLNGLVNLNTGALVHHQRNLYLTTQLPYAYDPAAQSPLWLKFLSSALVTADGRPDMQLICLLQEAFGYSITDETSREKAFWLSGAPGTGKSTVIEVLEALLGSAYLSIDFNSLEKNQYQLADLPGKRVAGCTEAKAGARLPDNILKPLISGEVMTARQIYNSTIRFRPKAKVWWAMNEHPDNHDHSRAMARRLVIIPFNHAVPEAQKDVHLKAKLRSELPGILNWALEGLKRLRTNGHFTSVSQVEDAVAEFQAANDVEAAFLHDEEWCVLDANEEVQASVFYAAYRAWCDSNGQPAKSNTKVASDWKRLGLEKYQNGVRYYRGVSLTRDAQNRAVARQANPRR